MFPTNYTLTEIRHHIDVSYIIFIFCSKYFATARLLRDESKTGRFTGKDLLVENVPKGLYSCTYILLFVLKC